jgi:hypothetical protein
MSEIDNWVDAGIHRARQLGKEHGSNASCWWIQESLTKAADARERAHMVLHMDEVGDPAIPLPTADLSGQWADGVSAKDVLDHALENGGWDGDDRPTIADIEILDAYEEAFNDAARDECLAACRNELAS